MAKRPLTWRDKYRVIRQWLRNFNGHGLITSCEFCRSTRIKRAKPNFYSDFDGRKHYKAFYECADCGALGHNHEVWARPDEVEK
jgi:hypothetical protein